MFTFVLEYELEPEPSLNSDTSTVTIKFEIEDAAAVIAIDKCNEFLSKTVKTQAVLTSLRLIDAAF